MNYKISGEILNPKTTKYSILLDDTQVTYLMWVAKMQSSDDFILAFNQTLIDTKFGSFFWEVKPVTKTMLSEPFEFVIVNSEALAKISQDDTEFSQYFNASKMVVDFANINGDAELIVPTPLSQHTKYAHLAQFVRTASKEQLIAFWKKVAFVYQSKIGEQAKWLSTSGLGVYWLHVRIDSRPKYYQHQAYKTL